MTTTAPRIFGSFNVDEVTSAPLQDTRSVRLNANQQQVFDFVSDHLDWSSWFPILTNVTIDNSKAEIAGGNGAIRHCTLVNGAQFAENILGYEAPSHFGYAIEDDNPLGVQGHLAVVHLEPTGDNETVLSWYQYFNHPDVDAMKAQIDEALGGAYQHLIERFGGAEL